MSDMAALSPRTFTVDEYHRIAELGIFDDERVELLDGLIVEMSPIGTRHWHRHALIVAYLNEHLRERAFVVGQGSFPLGQHNEPQPDIALLSWKLSEGPARRAEPDEIFACVELADSSLAKDLGPKLRLYGRYGIPDYLVVDLKANVLLRFREPHELGYRDCDRLTLNATFSLAKLPGVILDAKPFLE
jgi:Uma2 family endonuclease